MTPALYAACVRAVHVVTADGRILRAGRAGLFIFDQIGYHRFAWLFTLPVLSQAAELGYWIVAHNRALFGRFLFRSEQPLPAACSDKDDDS
jgi:hypothetical protein